LPSIHHDTAAVFQPNRPTGLTLDTIGHERAIRFRDDKLCTGICCQQWTQSCRIEMIRMIVRRRDHGNAVQLIRLDDAL
jgi:hypothetical protein